MIRIGTGNPYWTALNDVLFRSVWRSTQSTSSAPHIRSAASTDRLLNTFVVASLPAFFIGCWAIGATRLATDSAGDSVAGEPIAILWAQFASGISAFMPALVVAAAVGLVWEVVFAGMRRRPGDAGWFASAWLFSLLLTAAPLWMVAVSYSFGVVFGKHIFGGTGRYIVSPPLLAAVFLNISYPMATSTSEIVGENLLTWNQVATGVLSTSSTESVGWVDLFIVGELGSFGSPSAAACLIGAAFLCYFGAASIRTVIGGIAGIATIAYLLPTLSTGEILLALPGLWHLGLGSFAFALAFIATDPTTTPTTRLGRWVFGGLLGGLTVLIRELNPDHPDGALIAVLLSMLCVPLIDHATVRFAIRRRQRRRAQ